LLNGVDFHYFIHNPIVFIYCKYTFSLHNRLIILHGFPTATQRGGMLRVTTLPAPIAVPSPISTPGRIGGGTPIQTFDPILIPCMKFLFG